MPIWVLMLNGAPSTVPARLRATTLASPELPVVEMSDCPRECVTTKPPLPCRPGLPIGGRREPDWALEARWCVLSE